MMTFEDLLADPPEMKTRLFILDDGREYVLHDLPAIVLDDVYQKSQKKELPIRDAARVVAHALLGHTPTENDVERLMTFTSSDTILDIFKKALSIASVTDENVEAAKKPSPQTTIDA